jgi:ubiquinone/menaquinone biosynthesis C-methylase UbiE
MTLDSVQKEYARLAPDYDRRWSFYIEATLQATLSHLEIQSGDRVLDLGCGTGTLIQHLLEIAPEAEIVGLDSSAEMLNISKQKLPASVQLQMSSAESVPFPSNGFDILVSTSALHYFRNPDRAVQEMQRVLKPSGRLILTDWCYDYWTCRGLDLWLRLRLRDRAYCRTYGTSDLKQMLQAGRFEVVAIERYKIDWLWGMMTATAVKRSDDP